MSTIPSNQPLPIVNPRIDRPEIRPVTVNSEGLATASVPDPNFVQTVFGRVQRGGTRSSVPSLAGLVARQSGGVMSRIGRTEGGVVLDGETEPIPEDNLSGPDILRAITPPLRRLVRENLGIDESYWSKYKTFKEAETNLGVRLEAFRQDTALRNAGFWSGGAAFVLDLATDPLNLLAPVGGLAVRGGLRGVQATAGAISKATTVAAVSGRAASVARRAEYALETARLTKGLFLVPSRPAITALGARNALALEAGVVAGASDAVTQILDQNKAVSEGFDPQPFDPRRVAATSLGGIAFARAINGLIGGPVDLGPTSTPAAVNANVAFGPNTAASTLAGRSPTGAVTFSSGLDLANRMRVKAGVLADENAEMLGRYGLITEHLPFVQDPEWFSNTSKLFPGINPQNLNKLLKSRATPKELIDFVKPALDKRQRLNLIAARLNNELSKPNIRPARRVSLEKQRDVVLKTLGIRGGPAPAITTTDQRYWLASRYKTLRGSQSAPGPTRFQNLTDRLKFDLIRYNALNGRARSASEQIEFDGVLQSLKRTRHDLLKLSNDLPQAITDDIERSANLLSLELGDAPLSAAEKAAILADSFLPTVAGVEFGPSGPIAQVLHWVGTRTFDVDRLATAGTGLAQIKHLNNPMLNTLASLVSETAGTTIGIGPGAAVAPSLHVTRMKTMGDLFRKIPTFLDEMRTLSPADREAFRKEVLLHWAEPGYSSTSPRAKAAADEIRNYLGELGDRGVDAGALREKIDDFFPFAINETVLIRNRGQVVQDLHEAWVKFYRQNGELHMGTLESLGIIRRDADAPDGFLLADAYKTRIVPEITETITQRTGVPQVSEGYAAIPKNSGDLTVKDLARYQKAIADQDGVLKREAEDAIARRLGERPVGDQRANRVSNRIDSGRQRRIEQALLLNRKNLDSGLIATDIDRQIIDYTSRTGYRIAEQEAINRFVGQKGFTWDDLIAAARMTGETLSASNPDKRQFLEIVDIIARKRDYVAHQLPDVGGGENADVKTIVKLLRAPAVGAVNATTGLLASAELAASMVDSLFTARSIGDVFGRSLRKVSKEIAEDIAITWEEMRPINRHVFELAGGSDPVAYTNRDLVVNPYREFREVLRGNLQPRSGTTNNRTIDSALSFLEGSAEVARLVGGEAWITGMSRRLVIGQAARRVSRRLDALEKLAALRDSSPATGDLVKRWRGLARQAGFGSQWDVAQRMAQNGLVDRDVVAGLRAAKRLVPGSLETNTRTVAAAMTKAKDETTRRQLAKAYDALASYYRNEVDTLVTRPRAWDVRTAPGDRGPMDVLLNQFLSFSRAFYGNRLTRLYDSRATHATFVLGTYIVMETFISQLRQVITGGESPETLAAKWEENPQGMLASSILRTPFFGPMTDVGLALGQAISGEHVQPSALAGGAAAPGMAASAAIATSRFFSRLFDGEQGNDAPTDAELRQVSKMIPIWSWLPVRLAQRIAEAQVTGELADQDRLDASNR